MPDYKENILTGRVWTRCFQVVVDNPLGGQPRITFQEEKVYDVQTADGQQLHIPVPGCGAEFDPGSSFPLVHPVTGEPLGTSMSHQELQVALYSLYVATAAARDTGFGGL